jgi:hypothetical protein
VHQREERVSSDEGLPLGKAIRVYGDPELWAAYESTRAKMAGIPLRPRWTDTSRREREAWLDRYEAAERAARAAGVTARRALKLDFTRRLQRGELVATGIKLPISEQIERIVIPARLWSVLVPNFEYSSAKRGEFKVIDVRVRRAPLESGSDRGSVDPGEQDGVELQEAVAEEADAAAPPVSADTNRRKRGQPSLKGYIEAELERRAEDNRLRENQAEEFRSLELGREKSKSKVGCRSIGSPKHAASRRVWLSATKN